jgi:hypothetical protein
MLAMTLSTLLAPASLALLVAASPSQPKTPPAAPPQKAFEAAPGEDRSPAASKLADAYRRAHEARDAAAFEKLVEWRNVTASTREALVGSFRRDAVQRLDEIHVTPVDPKEVFEYTLESVTYRPNLTPERVLTVVMEMAAGGTQKTSYIVGRASDGSYRIATAAPVR